MKMKKFIPMLAGILVLTGSSAFAQEYVNESIGLKMQLEDEITVIDAKLLEGLGKVAVIDFAVESEFCAELMVLSDESETEMGYQSGLEEAVKGTDDKICVANKNGYTYLFYIANPDDQGMEQKFADAQFSVPVPVTLAEREVFTTVNADGEEVTDAIFDEKDLTVVNVWATWCNPCINEMPELAAWEKELPENVQLYYLCYNVTSLDDKENVKIIDAVAQKAGIDRKHILLMEEDGLMDLQSQITAVPTTFFIDKNGKLLDNVVTGAYVEQYKETVDEILAGK